MEDRIMNIFTLIAEQVCDRRELFQEEGRLVQSLLNSGFRLHEADAAVTLMQNLARRPDDLAAPEPRSEGMRTLSREERSRFTLDAFSFAVKLSHLGIISEDQREDLIEKALSAEPGRIDLRRMQALVAGNLFNGVPEPEEFTEAGPDPAADTAWN